MRSVGIDIGTSQVRIVELQTTSKGFQIVAHRERTLSRATGTDLELEIIEFLREVAAEYDPSQTRFCVGLRQDKVAVRNKMFPFADRLRIQKTLPFELEEDLPFSSDNAIFDGKIVRQVGTGAEVLAAAAPKQHIEHLLRLMKDSGIAPHLVSSEGTAFANLFEHWSLPVSIAPAPPPSLTEEEVKPSRPIRVVLNIGHTRTLVCAFDNQHLVGVRSILWGGNNLVEAIAAKYSLPLSEAQKELENKGFILTARQDVSFEAKIFSDLIAKGVRELIRDLQLSLLEFRSEFGGEITAVQMTGGCSGIQGLGPFMTQHLEVPVNRVDILSFFPNILFERTPGAELRLGSAIGMAIEGLRKPRNPALNFMKGEFAKQSNFVKDLWTQWGGVAQVAMVAFVGLCVWTYTRGFVSADLEEASKQALRNQGKAIAHLPAKSANEKNVKKYISDNRKKIAEIRTIESLAGMNSAMDVLNKISSSLPDARSSKIDILELSIKDNRAKLSGFVAGGREAAENIRSRLGNVAVNGQVTLDAVQPGPQKTGFRISFNVDRNIQKATK